MKTGGCTVLCAAACFLVRKGYALIFGTDGASAELVRAPPSAEADRALYKGINAAAHKKPPEALSGGRGSGFGGC